MIAGLRVEQLLQNFISEGRDRHIELIVADTTSEYRTLILNLYEEADVEINQNLLMDKYEYVKEMEIGV